MNKFYMLVGIPCSGKSQICNQLDGEVFSSDALRKELWGNENTQGDNSVLFNELHKRIKNALTEGKNCIYDATNISAKRRISFLNYIKKVKCEKICIFMATDYDLCLRRNEVRDRKVPLEVIKRMYLSIDIPQYREGWDKIKIYRTLDENKKYDLFEKIDQLKLLEHDNPHHSATVGNHIQSVTEHIIDKYKLLMANDLHRLEDLIMAAMCHDIGKQSTKQFKNINGQDTEIAHYYFHEHVSAYQYLLYENEEFLNNNLDRVLYRADLIQLHMRLFCKDSEINRVYEKLYKMVGKREIVDLHILHEADVLSS